MKLIRYNYTDRITQGILFYEGVYLADTLELAWKDNQHVISCIPEGTYKLGLHISTHLGMCISILAVPNRTDILIHIANDVSELKGCIAPGIKSINRVINSRLMLDRILSTIDIGATSLVIERIKV